MAYQEHFPPTVVRPALQIDALSAAQSLWFVLKLSFSNTTWLAFGALLQGFLFLLPIPRYYAILPCCLHLLYRLTLTCLITWGIIPNHYLKGAIPYRYTSLVPDQYGNFPTPNEAPSNQKIAVLILCARVNHPLGWLGSPYIIKFGEFFEQMHDDLKKMPQAESGLLGHSQAYMPGQDGLVELVLISYWRSKEHIQKFADSPTHRETMKWWTDLGGFDGKGGKIPHIGIGHEIYEAQPGHWENVFSGFQPTLIGATSYLRTSEAGKGALSEEWISPVIDAKRGKLVRSRGRMGTAIYEKEETAAQV